MWNESKKKKKGEKKRGGGGGGGEVGVCGDVRVEAGVGLHGVQSSP